MSIMEGSHTTLQLLPPITELWYISLYFPRPRAGGFTHCSTVQERARNTGNCWEPQEKLWTAKRRAHWDVTLRELLTQLHRLSAEEEKLLASLLSSHLLLHSSMGNQDEKLQKEDDSASPQDLADEKRPDSRIKKSRTFSRRRESLGGFLNTKIQRKVSGGQESLGAVSKDIPAWKEGGLSDSGLQGSSACSWLHSVENKDESVVLEINNQMGKQRKARCLLESTRNTDSDTDHGNSLYEFDNDIFTDCQGLSQSQDVLGNVAHIREVLQPRENIPCLKCSLQDSLLERSRTLSLSSTENHDWGIESHILQTGPAVAPEAGVSLEQQRTTDTASSSELQWLPPGDQGYP
uniref:Uncharacterized protein LOC117363588 n=1 Tax=Geotrypetes seraphini TaxID=260995 RepID=A0A6P8RQ18_GEOSA|nr:uncharacterized protein LOC117363588 [Geotrypetes seraphini]